MIHFRDQKAALFWQSDGRQCKQFSSCAKILMRKLRMLDAAKELSDLRVPPGNRLEALRGQPRWAIFDSRQYSISRLFCLDR